jgi:EAL domain-containing protein (putative c-di-GMP-specific phosphodiesterase class I)
MLRDMGADTYQGYLLSPPLPPAQCQAFLRSRISTPDFA